MEMLEALWEPRTKKRPAILEELKDLVQNIPEGTVISISLIEVNDAEEKGK